MIVLDANILLHAYDSRSPHHAKARAWVERTFSSSELIGIPWSTVGAFLRVTTNPRLQGTRLTLAEAVEIVDRWFEQPGIRMLDGQASGPLASDAQFAALTMEWGGELHTSDRDFARFPGLRWKNPLR